jgi:flagellar basal body-associated protein FliL
VVVYRVLLAIAVIVALSLLGGTLYAVIVRKALADDKALSSRSVADQTSQVQHQALSLQTGQDSPENAMIFTGIGRIRTITGDSQPATVILSIAFPYNSADRAFSEELASRVKNFRDIASEYFRKLTLNELRRQTEEDIKSALLYQYNDILRLGQIETLFFSDYMLIE